MEMVLKRELADLARSLVPVVEHSNALRYPFSQRPQIIAATAV
jgi:hypothetical protein